MESIDVSVPSVLKSRVENAYGPLGYCNRSEFARAAMREKLAREEGRLPPEATVTATADAVPADA
ncbi:hypothetical protein [Halorussus litoreus]|uniref:hypothetical protein n=1 Tax=Halorussus litoreus TaxID=1710536 RepID=UPI000E22039C|nr:hypothetical protein [Halorussus litoreus]